MAATVAVGIQWKVLLDEWARSDETHIASQHVDQLRELVERGRAQSPPERRDASIIGQELAAAIALVGHRAKLEELEWAIAEAGAALSEEHRATKADANRDADDQEQRNPQRASEQHQRQVEQTLSPVRLHQ
jgi:hypothetical protein